MAFTAATAVSADKAGFWIRAVAYIVDAVIVQIVAGIVNQAIYGDMTGLRNGNLVNLLLSLLYFAYFWSGPGGSQTLGMRIFDLKVIRTDGSALTYTQSAIRFVGLVVSFAVIFIGVIWVAFDPNRQGWHDKIASTYVIRSK